ncbi:FKBP-type peptidyl-prolyl cis-trans isomerase 2 [Trichlorobacter thiogenes]|uniref:Peptidyl-prolyl cis-trans isomerase n=1 Tax=Trichlorobacter thiogenes TaxID=115783 RepID=A0A1T4RT10_9BACT|nr:FKBP-type peptidyl-prolyl cis-trans isomerase [Trichlorobacter thiogenes]SKA19037.1 FKBP-type peptidyl-prolyl cis-trans isomerase 2 [Trichlorobacter thiogenes]
MKQAQHGSTITVSYIGTLDNGRIFDSTEENSPLTFTIGTDQVFAALEQAIIGMTAGETKNIIILAADAYGPRLDANIIKVKRDMFPADRELRIGEKLRIEFNGGRERILIVLDQNEQEVTLDGNHPLAGLDLTFALRLDAVE